MIFIFSRTQANNLSSKKDQRIRISPTTSTMAANTQQYVKLAQSLPPRLLRFFARYPPQAILPQSQSGLSSSSEPTSTITSASDSTASQLPQGQDGLTVPSPFRSQKHPVTGRWHDPVFSLRRQAELVSDSRLFAFTPLTDSPFR
jgi:large subunit ribosomal protein L25